MVLMCACVHAYSPAISHVCLCVRCDLLVLSSQCRGQNCSLQNSEGRHLNPVCVQLSSSMDLYHRPVVQKAKSILMVSAHPLHGEFQI